MLKEILSVSGKPGLFKSVSQGKNMLIAEALADGKRIPLYPRDKVVSLGDISIYSTGDDDRPLYQIFADIKKKEEGKAIEFNAADPAAMKRYFTEIFPEYDEDRVYISDIKKILNWYNILIAKGLDDFEAEKPSEEELQDEEEKGEENQQS
jgi:hypothetical protein